jgi:hypothetical protein
LRCQIREWVDGGDTINMTMKIEGKPEATALRKAQI